MAVSVDHYLHLAGVLERVECPDAGTNGLFLGLVQVFAVSHQLLFVV